MALVEKAAAFAKEGAGVTLIARALGYQKDVYKDWLHVGSVDVRCAHPQGGEYEKQRQLAVILFQRVTIAQAHAAVRLIGYLSKSAKRGNDRAAIYLLENIAPAEYRDGRVGDGAPALVVQFVVPPNGR